MEERLRRIKHKLAESECAVPIYAREDMEWLVKEVAALTAERDELKAELQDATKDVTVATSVANSKCITHCGACGSELTHRTTISNAPGWLNISVEPCGFCKEPDVESLTAERDELANQLADAKHGTEMERTERQCLQAERDELKEAIDSAYDTLNECPWPPAVYTAEDVTRLSNAATEAHRELMKVIEAASESDQGLDPEGGK